MTDNDIVLKLSAGHPIVTENEIAIYSPKLKTIVEMSESRYNELLSILLIDKDSFGNTEQVKALDLFELYYWYCLEDQEFKNLFIKSIFLFTKEEIFIGNDGSLPLFYFGDKEEKRWITQYNFEYIRDLIRKANFIKKAEKEVYTPGNKEAEEFIKELEERDANRPKPKETMNLASMINGLAWRPNDVNIFNIFELTLFQLYSGFFVTENFDNYQFTLNGIYTGNVDGKKIDLNKMHWAKKLEK